MLLQLGQTLHGVFGAQPLVVEGWIGGGGQGEVYLVNLEGWQCALKWYAPNYLPADPLLRRRLITAIQSGPPSDKFLWPIDLAEGARASFGYLMPLRDPAFCDLNDLMRRKVDPSFRAVATAGLYLAHSFLLLHTKGLCYRDISRANVFLESDTGDVRICDNDNVDAVGEPSGIWGTLDTMAPEVLVHHAPHSIETDLHSLAVLLFYMLLIHHPLEGRRELAPEFNGREGRLRLYGQQPLFIFDPRDRSNEPISGAHRNALTFWPLYPRFLRDLFTRAFTDGLADPSARVRESEWRQAMARLTEAVVPCPVCGAESFIDDVVQPIGLCWSCKVQLNQPPRLILRDHPLALVAGAKLCRFHLDGSFIHDPFKVIGEVVAGSGLRNLSGQTWALTVPNTPPREILPGDVVPLVDRSVIRFGRTAAQIQIL
jgi:DNA-binding helix-hairpin-helix protein with protein kinase domain